MSLPASILKCEVVSCIPEEMRYMDLNSSLEELGFRDVTNYDNVADMVAHLCAGTTQVIFAVVDQDDDTVAEQIDFIRLIASRLIIVRLMDSIPASREEIENITEFDILVDNNDLDDSITQIVPFLKNRAASVELYQKWITSRQVSAPAPDIIPGLAKTCHVKEDLIKANPDNLNVQGAFIGKGSVGDVFQSNCSLISKPMAAKNIDVKKLSPALLKSLERELSVMTKLPPNNHLIRFFYNVEPIANSNRKLYMELCKTSVQSVMKGGFFPVEMAKTVMQHLVKALEFLHTNNIVHRDVKPDNILVAYDGIYKLADLGSSIEADAKTKIVTEKQDLAGTLKYMAPEVFNGHTYGCSADVWSAGIVLLDILGQGLPKDGASDVVPSFFNPDKPDEKSPVPLPLTLPKDVSNFLVMCLQRDPTLRATPTQLLATPFLKGPAMSAKNVSQYVGKSMVKANANNASAVIPSLAGQKNVNLESLANSCSHSDVLSFLSKK